MNQVKGKQAERARQTRERMLTAAAELFVERGYGTVPLQEVADRAGVAVQTIYFTFRNKRNLLKALIDVTVAGDDEPITTMDREWFTRAMVADTADEHLRMHVGGAAAVLERAAEITEVLRTAKAMEPELDELWRQGLANRYAVQEVAAKNLLAKPGSRADLTPAVAADILFALLSPETYLLFTRDRGWSAATWREWTYNTLKAQLIQA